MPLQKFLTSSLRNITFKNDEGTRVLVESFIKALDEQYKIPVSIRQGAKEFLPTNYQYVLKRTK